MQLAKSKGYTSLLKSTAPTIAACATAVGVFCGNMAQAEPAISSVYPDGSYLLQPSVNLSFTASSPAGVTNVSVQLTLTNMSTLQSYVRTLSSANGLIISGPSTRSRLRSVLPIPFSRAMSQPSSPPQICGVRVP